MTKVERRDGPIRLLDQYQMTLFASKDTRLSGCDQAVLAEIVDRLLKKDSEETRPTGLGHLTRETGRAKCSVQKSVDRLKEYGYVHVIGAHAGSTGHTFAPNFEWARDVAALIGAEIESRMSAKTSRGKRTRAFLG